MTYVKATPIGRRYTDARAAFLMPLPISCFCKTNNPLSHVSSNPCRYSYCTSTRPRRMKIKSCTEENPQQPQQEQAPGAEEEQSEPRFKHKFDPNSETDAFGRDPRKETEFWMDTAKSVLESDDVKKAIADHAADGGDGLTEEQRAYMEFIKSLDEKKKDAE